jgi:hypothetical protein
MAKNQTKNRHLPPCPLPVVGFIANDKGGEGKSLLAKILASRCRVAGLPMSVVEVDTQGQSLKVLGPDVISITIDAKTVRRDPAAGLRALTPLFGAIETTCKKDGLTIVEFGANEASRGALWSGMVDLQDELTAFGAQALVLTPMTRQAESMRRGIKAGRAFLDVLPAARFVLVENERDGRMLDLHPSSDAAEVYRNLIVPLTEQATMIRMPLIEAGSWQPFEAAGVSFVDAVTMTIENVMSISGLPKPEAKIIRGDVAGWAEIMFSEFDKLIDFGDLGHDK